MSSHFIVSWINCELCHRAGELAASRCISCFEWKGIFKPCFSKWAHTKCSIFLVMDHTEFCGFFQHTVTQPQKWGFPLILNIRLSILLALCIVWILDLRDMTFLYNSSAFKMTSCWSNCCLDYDQSHRHENIHLCTALDLQGGGRGGQLAYKMQDCYTRIQD